MLEIAGVVILYHPDVMMTIENIKSYAPFLKKLYVLDNSETQNEELKHSLQYFGNKVSYHIEGKNEGLAKRLNQAANYAISDGFSYLLTMDQDSRFENGLFEKYVSIVESTQLENVAQFGVNTNPAAMNNSNSYEVVSCLITSGTIMDLSIFEKVGPFEEKLFIDFVDVEYGLRCKHEGYLNISYPSVLMSHSKGYIKLGRSLKNFKKTPRILHAPIRIYYMIRNGLYMYFKATKIEKKEIKYVLLEHANMLKNDFIYHDHLLGIYLNAFKGLIDFAFGKMGKK